MKRPKAFNRNFFVLSEKVCELNFLPKVKSLTYHFLGSFITVILYGYQNNIQIFNLADYILIYDDFLTPFASPLLVFISRQIVEEMIELLE
jgi:hypothetical protein